MTTAATARVWLALSGVVAGIVYSEHRFPTRGAVACIVIGVACAWTRRDRIVGMVGILFVAAGLAAFHPVAPTREPPTWGGAVTDAYRDSLKSALEAAPERPRGLLAGLTIGDTSAIDYEDTEMFRRSGLAHLVAVSGSNVAMVLAAIAVLTVVSRF